MAKLKTDWALTGTPRSYYVVMYDMVMRGERCRVKQQKTVKMNVNKVWLERRSSIFSRKGSGVGAVKGDGTGVEYY